MLVVVWCVINVSVMNEGETEGMSGVRCDESSCDK